MATAAVEDLLRLAWQADVDGRPGMRDAILTLTVAECGPADAVLAERCRKLLAARRPDHWFATSATLGQALSHKKVIEALARLRATFPPMRVARLLMKGAVLGGPFLGRPLPLSRVLCDLSLEPEDRATKDKHLSSRPLETARALPFPGAATTNGPADSSGPDPALIALYWSVWVAMAALLSTVVEASARESRAA